MIEYFQNENVYKLPKIRSSRRLAHVTQFVGKKSKIKVIRAHNVYLGRFTKNRKCYLWATYDKWNVWQFVKVCVPNSS